MPNKTPFFLFSFFCCRGESCAAVWHCNPLVHNLPNVECYRLTSTSSSSFLIARQNNRKEVEEAFSLFSSVCVFIPFYENKRHAMMIMRRRETPENVHVAHSTECAHVAASSVTNGIRRDDPDFERLISPPQRVTTPTCVSPLHSTRFDRHWKRERKGNFYFILLFYFCSFRIEPHTHMKQIRGRGQGGVKGAAPATVSLLYLYSTIAQNNNNNPSHKYGNN